MGKLRSQITSQALILFASLVLLMACNTDNNTYVKIETPYGDMKAVLYDETPLHKENFIKLVEEGFYDSLLFHRVIKGFMIQGGDPESKNAPTNVRLGKGGPGYTIPAEIGAPHIKGTLAAARQANVANPLKESSGSQFYIVHGQTLTTSQLSTIERSKGIQYNDVQKKLYVEKGGTPILDQDYTVFGELISGLDVLDKIATADVDRNTRPVQDVWMKITIE